LRNILNLKKLFQKLKFWNSLNKCSDKKKTMRLDVMTFRPAAHRLMEAFGS
jgi:hypothetical protein